MRITTHKIGDTFTRTRLYNLGGGTWTAVAPVYGPGGSLLLNLAVTLTTLGTPDSAGNTHSLAVEATAAQTALWSETTLVSEVVFSSGALVRSAEAYGIKTLRFADGTDSDDPAALIPGALLPALRGEQGISAYEVAVENGFVGTEAAWLASLVGPAGPGVPAGGTTGQVLAKASNTDHDTEWVAQTGGSGGGATNLAYTASPTGGTVTSDTGTDATLPLADATNAGLMAPAQHTKLAGIAAGATAVIVDATPTNGSGNAVSSDGVFDALANKSDTSHTHTGTYQPLATVLTNTTASFTTAQETKLGHIAVTQAVDLDDIETRVNALDAAVILKGTWDASAGTFPGAGAAQAGWSYIVSVAGTVDGTAFAVGDRAIAILDNASTTTYAANWFKADYTDQVLSVHGRAGAVTAQSGDYTSDQVTEGSTNLYHTAARVRAALLTGISTAAGTVVAATHTVLEAIGFLQKQVSDNTSAISGKQATLVSGTNIKTINSTSLLGSGDITVSAAPGGSTTQVQYNNAGALAGAPGITTTGTELTISSGTQTTNKPVIDLSQTWNAGAVSFTGIKVDITDTASATGSLIADFQVSSASKMRINKNGHLRVLDPGSATDAAVIVSGAALNTGIFATPASNLAITSKGTAVAVFSSTDTRFGTGSVGFASAAGNVVASDVGLSRVSAGVLGAGTGAPGSFAGSIKLKNMIGTGNLATGIASKTADYTVTNNDGALEGNATSGAVPFTLPALAGCTAGQEHQFVKTDSSANAMTVDANASETINGSTSALSTTTQWGAFRLKVNADKSGWLSF